MEATIKKVGAATKNGNVIVTLEVQNGTVEVFGVKKPKKKQFLMALPADEAAELQENTVQENFNLAQFEQVKRDWTDEETGEVVTNTWLHTIVD